MVRCALLDDAETLFSQRFCQHCKVQPGCVIFGYSNGPPTLRRRNAGRSGVVYELNFVWLLQEGTKRSSPQKWWLQAKWKRLAFLHVKIDAMPGGDVELLEIKVSSA